MHHNEPNCLTWEHMDLVDFFNSKVRSEAFASCSVLFCDKRYLSLQ